MLPDVEPSIGPVWDPVIESLESVLSEVDGSSVTDGCGTLTMLAGCSSTWALVTVPDVCSCVVWLVVV